MKRLFRYILFALGSLCLVSCGGEEPVEETVVTLSVTPSSASVAAEETSFSFEVSCNSDWTVTCSDAWITNYTRTGSGNGRLDVNFSENIDKKSERFADFVIKAGVKIAKCKLTQGCAGEELTLSVEQNLLTVEATEKSARVKVLSNVGWSVSTESDWILDYTRTGHDNAEIEISFDQNDDSTKDREALFTVTGNSVESVTFKLVQKKCLPGEVANEVSLAQFCAAPDDGNKLYRIKGFIDVVVSSHYGSVRLCDATGTAFTYCLKDKKDGADCNFESLGISHGDYIVVVGNRREFPGVVELVNGYHESHKTVTRLSLAEFVDRPSGATNWYKIRGTVKSISDPAAGTLILEDGGVEVEVGKILTGINGEEGKFDSFHVGAGDQLTLVSSRKDGNKAEECYYISHSATGMPSGVVAKWDFSVDALTAYDNDYLWTGRKVGEPGKSGDAVEQDATAGSSNGRLLYPVGADGNLDKNGYMCFVQRDKTSEANADKARHIMYYSGQPGIGGVAQGDYFQWVYNCSGTIVAGTKIKFSFVLRPAETSIGYWLLQYADGDDMVAFPSLPVKSVEAGGISYDYNIQRAGRDESVVEAIYVVPSDTEKIELRIVAAAPLSPDGTYFPTGMSTGDMRFRGGNPKKFPDPTIEIL